MNKADGKKRFGQLVCRKWNGNQMPAICCAQRLLEKCDAVLRLEGKSLLPPGRCPQFVPVKFETGKIYE
jgi:hypothetical protein